MRGCGHEALTGGRWRGGTHWRLGFGGNLQRDSATAVSGEPSGGVRSIAVPGGDLPYGEEAGVVSNPGLKSEACVWIPSQFRVPRKACGFDFNIRHIRAHCAILGAVVMHPKGEV